MLRLEEMLEPKGADKRTQLEAIKLLMRMNGTAETEEPQGQVRPHNLNNIIMFEPKEKGEEGRCWDCQWTKGRWWRGKW